jgi:hypothetical protein
MLGFSVPRVIFLNYLHLTAYLTNYLQYWSVQPLSVTGRERKPISSVTGHVIGRAYHPLPFIMFLASLTSMGSSTCHQLPRHPPPSAPLCPSHLHPIGPAHRPPVVEAVPSPPGCTTTCHYPLPPEGPCRHLAPCPWLHHRPLPLPASSPPQPALVDN